MTPYKTIEEFEEQFYEQSKIDAAKLQRAKSKLERELLDKAATIEAYEASTMQVRDTVRQAGQALDSRLGGDWKELALVMTSAVGGLASGYLLQRAVDLRVPVFALAGTVLIGAGALARQGWAVRGALIVGGATMAGGSTVYLLTRPDGTQAAPPVTPPPQGAR